MSVDGTGPGKKQYAPILPAPSSSSSSSNPGHTRTSELPPKRQKRVGTGRFACDACRARKSACDSRRPKCSTCTKRQSPCVYTPHNPSGISLEEQVELGILRQQNDDFRKQHGGAAAADVLESVRTLPEDQALVLFHQLRASASSGVSTIITTDDIRPAAALSLEYELMMRHPVLYPVVSPGNKIILPVANAGQMSRREQHQSDEDLSRFLVPLRNVEHPKYSIPSPEQPSPIPKHSDLCDQRLALFDVHSWLQCPVPSELAARAISFYLTTEHPILALFDADLFLNDLIARRTDFCSPLLLSSVLCVACQGYTAIDLEAANYSHELFAEAERLYSEEKTGGPQYESATMTIAAARLLCEAATCHGRVRTASRYLFDGVQMAHANGLLAVPRRDGARHWLDDNIDNVRAAAHAAWGTFSTAILYGTNDRNALVDIQPWLPIPGTLIDREDGSTIPFHLPPYMGQSFTQFCKLAPLINRILHQCRLAPNDRTSDLAEETYMMLLQWADSLPVVMGQGNDMPHHVAIVHIQFHAAILDLFRPSMQQNPKQPLELNSFSAKYRTVEDVCQASINQLKHLVLVFRTRYSCASSSFLWHNALLYVANDCLSTENALPKNKATEEDVEMSDANPDAGKRIIWFMACIDGYRALAPQFPILGGVLQGLLSLGIEKGLITAADGRSYMEGVKGNSVRPSRVNADNPERQWIGDPNLGPGLNLPENQGSFIVDLNGAMDDPNAASIEALSQRFKEVVMLHELNSSNENMSPK